MQNIFNDKLYDFNALNSNELRVFQDLNFQ